MDHRIPFVILSSLVVSLFLAGFVFSDTASTSVSIGNRMPWVQTPTVTDPIDLNEGAGITIYCNATITDRNGWEDIDEINASLWLNTGSETCASDPDNCYKNTSCTKGTGSSTDLDVNCSF
ncbi:MAG: hypothetical protein JXB14_00005, partial [Candidatus Altiarchaeota archaeon]|nr:hypothetical protein [Candidatus Altiarchaeota archaeon]